MQSRQRIVIAGIVGVLGVALTWIVLTPTRTGTGRRPPSVALPRPRSASERARQEARRWYTRATLLTKQQQDGMEAWDAPALERLGPEAHRRSVIARTTELHRSRDAAERAARLATTREEKYEALLLSRLDCDAGYHDRELVAARKLISLAPTSLVSLRVLRRAARCNRLVPLARQTDAAIAAVSEKDKASGKQSDFVRFRLGTGVASGKANSP
jgi:hypothetical protein